MGCNAHNHPWNCNCGWGGDTGSGGGASSNYFESRYQGRFINGARCWDSDLGSRLSSYTTPNANCPECGACVFFYQNENGSRVFFDPPLGPPWPKHPCTDNSRSPPQESSYHLKSQGSSRTSIERARPTLSLSPAESKDFVAHAETAFIETGWHPLLNIKIQNLGGMYCVTGFDPVEDRRCSIVSKSKFKDTGPIYIRISSPNRITCDVEQAGVNEEGRVVLLRDRGWLGVASLDEVRTAKKAREGDVEAMRAFARTRSYKYLGTDNQISEVSEWLDLDAALHWFDRAIKDGSDEANVERSYLGDIIAQSKTRIHDLAEVLRGSVAVAVCRRVAALRDAKLEARMNSLSFMQKFYDEQVLDARRALTQFAETRSAPRLSSAVKSILKSMEDKSET